MDGDHVRRVRGEDGEEYVESVHAYRSARVERREATTARNGEVKERYAFVPEERTFTMRTRVSVPKVGIMLVGWGGNNGSTLTAGMLANAREMTWKTKEGEAKANYYGSLTQCGTCRVAHFEGEEVHVPFKSLMPLANPNEVVVDGWDISDVNLADAMERAKVLEYDLQRQLRPLMEHMKPRPSVFDPNFVAGNQASRANNVIKGTKSEQMEQIHQEH